MALLDWDLKYIRTLVEYSVACPKIEVAPLSSSDESDNIDNSEVINEFHFVVDPATEADDEAENNDANKIPANIPRQLRRGGIPAYVKRPRTRKRRRWPVHPWSSRLQRQRYGAYDNLMVKMEREDPEAYQNYLRVSPQLFDEILGRIEHRIQRQHTNYRAPYPAGLKLAVTLRYLATGSSYYGLSYAFRLARSTVNKIIPEVCEAIHAEYLAEVINLLTTLEGGKKFLTSLKPD